MREFGCRGELWPGQGIKVQSWRGGLGAGKDSGLGRDVRVGVESGRELWPGAGGGYKGFGWWCGGRSWEVRGHGVSETSSGQQALTLGSLCLPISPTGTRLLKTAGSFLYTVHPRCQGEMLCDAPNSRPMTIAPNGQSSAITILMLGAVHKISPLPTRACTSYGESIAFLSSLGLQQTESLPWGLSGMGHRPD